MYELKQIDENQKSFNSHESTARLPHNKCKKKENEI